MYGGIKKSQKYIDIDNEFISSATAAAGGDRILASKQYVSFGWGYLYNKNDETTSMKRFNKAWLLNDKNPDVFVGFGAVGFVEPAGDGLAASLLFWLAALIVGASGGVLQLLDRPRATS